MRVLLIDTDPNLRRVLAEMLAWMGHTVAVSDGSDGLLQQSGTGLEGVDVLMVHHAPPGLEAAIVASAVHARGFSIPVIAIVDRIDGGKMSLEAPRENVIVIRQPLSLGMIRGAFESVDEAYRLYDSRNHLM